MLDVNLPKVSGAAVLEAMRQHQDLAAVPVAIMTSAEAPWEQTKAEELGIDCYITKPPDLEDFLQIGQILKQILLETKTSSGSPGVAGAIFERQ